MPEPARFVGVQIEVFFLQLGVLVVLVVATGAEPGAIDGYDAVSPLTGTVVAHE